MSNQDAISRKATQRWGDMMLDEATTEMDAQDMPITPQSLGQYFEREYELPLTADQAQIWLSRQPWYQVEDAAR